GLVLGSVVLHQLIRRLDVAADLRAPRVLAAVAAQRVHRRASLGALALSELRFKDLHGARAVLVLTSFVLTTHDDARGQVRDADRRVGLVDVLTTGTRGPVGVHAQILLVDLHLGGVVGEQRGHVKTRETRLATRLRVEGTDAHQTVHATFGRQPSVGEAALHDERRRQQSRLTALGRLVDLDAE